MSGFNVAATKAQVFDLVLNDPRSAALTVTYGMPVEGVAQRGIWFGGINGTSELPNMKGGRKERDVQWTIHGIAQVSNKGLTCDQAELQVERDVFQILDDALADDPKIAGAVADLRHAYLSSFNLDSAPQGDGEGWVAWITFEITCRSRLT